MNGSLATAFGVLFLASAPFALIARARWPGRVSWWWVSLGVAGVCWISLVGAEHFWTLADMECPPASPDSDAPVCVGRFVHYAETYNAQLGWFKGLIYLALLCPIYWAIAKLRRRFRASGSLPNTSLERTREG